MKRVIVDTGPLVAFFDQRDRHHAWVRSVLDGVDAPIYTCESVLSETCFLLARGVGGQDSVLDLVGRGIIRIDFRMAGESEALQALMQKFASVPMSLADACLVRMTELDRDSVVLTLDSDFRIYRRNQRQMVPTILPPTAGKGRRG